MEIERKYAIHNLPGELAQYQYKVIQEEGEKKAGLSMS